MEDGGRSRIPWFRLCVLVVLSIGAYLPALRLPFISDDFPQISLSRDYLAGGWTPLWHDTALRTRATYMILSAALDRVFGFTPAPFYAVSILMHVACVFLVYAMCVWREISSAAAFWAACFFAVYEGHQEAVMWLAAWGDLLVFLFGMAAWVCWMRWLRTSKWLWYAAALAAFLLGAASKESIIAFPVLMALPVVFDRSRWKRAAAGLAPFAGLVGIYLFWTWQSRLGTSGFEDIRFSAHAPWVRTVLNSTVRLLFVWGFVALGILVWRYRRGDEKKIALALFWIVAAFLPYSFLTYMTRVPSRATYVASAGLALLAGLAADRLLAESRRTLIGIVALLALLSNVEIIWVKKMAQFRDRAEPSDLLLSIAKRSTGPIFVDCTPLGEYTEGWVLKTAGSQGIFRPDPRQDPYCFRVEYTNRDGQRIRIDRSVGTARHGVFY